ncbi:hypothetical protein H4S14_001341 [Agrobacterium vitis]|nr:hypothetical protein [Agrobacterium vitis]MBE1437603.1 hypothetical protein [Agrobacterium vitis]
MSLSSIEHRAGNRKQIARREGFYLPLPLLSCRTALPQVRRSARGQRHVSKLTALYAESDKGSVA